MIKLSGLAALLVFAATSAVAHPQDAAINAVYARLAAARLAHDLAGMASGFHPQAVLIDARPGAPVVGADLATVMAPQRERLVNEGVSIQSAYRIERREVIGDDLAVDAGYMRQAMTREGAAEMVRYARFLVTLRRDGGAWKVVADAAMPSNAQAWDALAAKDGLRFDR